MTIGIGVDHRTNFRVLTLTDASGCSSTSHTEAGRPGRGRFAELRRARAPSRLQHVRTDVPELVTLHLWGVPRRRVPSAVGRMALDRGPLRGTAGLRFWKLLGTAPGTFSVRDADARHWGLLCAWDTGSAGKAFEQGPVAARWDRIAGECLRVAMRPLAAKGTWSGQAPFGHPEAVRYDGPVAAVTRARLRLGRARTFCRAVPPVAAALRSAPGLRLGLAIGEAPLVLQGTFSVWDSPAHLSGFAYGSPQHADVVRRTGDVGWYAEELFARLAVLSVDGTYNGVRP